MRLLSQRWGGVWVHAMGLAAEMVGSPGCTSLHLPMHCVWVQGKPHMQIQAAAVQRLDSAGKLLADQHVCVLADSALWCCVACTTVCAVRAVPRATGMRSLGG